MSDAPAGPGWWQASDGRWYPPDAGAAPASPTPAAPGPAATVVERPPPAWVRPVYLYFLCFVGIALAALGALTTVLGLAHLAVPSLSQGDPLTRIATAVIDVADATLAAEEAADEAQADELEDEFGDDFEGTFESDTDEAREALSRARDEIDEQTRYSAANQLLQGLVLMGIGAAVYLFHFRRAERMGQPVPAAPPVAAAPVPPPPPPPPPA